jgi:hypothetical protein
MEVKEKGVAIWYLMGVGLKKSQKNDPTERGLKTWH